MKLTKADKQELIEKYEAALRKNAAEQGWRPSELAMALAGSVKEVERSIRSVQRKHRKAK